MKKFIAIFASLLFFSSLMAQKEPLLINVYNRDTKSLNGSWHYIVDPYENGFYNYRYQPFEDLKNPGSSAYFTNSKPKSKSDLLEYNFDESDTIQVPGDWNTQKERLFYYEGSLWYKKSFDYTKKNPSDKVFLYFGAVNYQADVYLNGKKIGKHVGGFTAFNFDITNLLKEKGNFLILKVDNTRKKDAVPTLNTDWFNYGGITRDVKLVETPPTYIQDYLIQLDPEDNSEIKGYIQLKGEQVADQTVQLEIPELGIKKKYESGENGKIILRLKARNVQYWSPENPKLYEVKLSASGENLIDTIGFRSIKTEGTKLLLNGKKIFLRGISIHEESPLHDGRAYSAEDAKKLLSMAKELGCNYVRLAHYQHNENMVRQADKMGILVWEENPVYWTISWDNEDTYKNAENQLSEEINRDKNRAAVIIWSMANETPVSEARNTFLGKLAKKARELDPTRLISAALEQSSYNGNPNIKTISDPYAGVVDILSFNEYIGWYTGLPDECEKITWKITQNKPVLISEFGAGAKYGYHGDKLTRWTEEFQKYYYEETLKMLDEIEQLNGFSPWILMDFRSPRRPLPKIQDGYNRKGLLSEKGEKKEAYFVLQQFYSDKIKEEN